MTSDSSDAHGLHDDAILAARGRTARALAAFDVKETRDAYDFKAEKRAFG